jgi:hypothetical protein
MSSADLEVGSARSLEDEDGKADDFIPDNPFDFVSDNAIYEDDDDGGFEDEEHGVAVIEKDVYTPSISEGDFLDPAQRFLFTQLKAHIRAACNVNSKPAAREKALEWIFVPSTSDKDALEFDPVCVALGGRPGVVRARTMHQLWRANIILNQPLPFLASLPPSSILSEIGALVGPGLAYKMAREIWFWPSIPAEVLRTKFGSAGERDYQAALVSLDANGYIGIAYGRLYFISRNPTILGTTSRGRFQFASSFYGD